jgi:hypothetical protein
LSFYLTYIYNIILLAGILTALTTLVTIIGKKEPWFNPEKVVSVESPTNLTVIDPVPATVTAPIKTAEGFCGFIGNVSEVVDIVAKSG